MKVRSFSEIKNEYDDFVIVVSFASSRAEVLDIFREIDKDYDVYFPDMPVAGEEYFDRKFYNAHYDEIAMAYDALADEASKACFKAVINYKLSGKLQYLLGAYSDKEDIYSLVRRDKIKKIIDAGAYNGDTLREAVEFFPRLKSACCIEADPRNFKKLDAFCKSLENIQAKAVNAAAWSENGAGAFSASGNRNSSVNATSSFEHKTISLDTVRIDSIADSADYIKYDVEGAEREALIGTDAIIKSDRPALLVSLYHRSEDIYSLINYIKSEYPFYKLYLRRTLCVPAWEIDLIAVPD
jgi:FkbM family methyltransferase